MKSAESAMLYNTNIVVNELNRVKGFDPLHFLKNTPEGPKLELKYKKIWFRLKYPQGRFKYTALKITDQLAIIEARVYFDKNDPEPKAVFTARSDKATAPGGMYIEAAQYAAIDQALTDAGFGLQFTRDNSTSTPTEDTKKETEVEQIPAETKATIPQVEETAVVQKTEASTVETVVQVETPAADPEPIPMGGYTNDMSVEEICARMTLAEAENYIVPLGTCNGQTMGQVADRRPASLRYYISGYSGDNNILRAAATLVSESRSPKAS